MVAQVTDLGSEPFILLLRNSGSAEEINCEQKEKQWPNTLYLGKFDLDDRGVFYGVIGPLLTSLLGVSGSIYQFIFYLWWNWPRFTFEFASLLETMRGVAQTDLIKWKRLRNCRNNCWLFWWLFRRTNMCLEMFVGTARTAPEKLKWYLLHFAKFHFVKSDCELSSSYVLWILFVLSP